jgi:hypothetical protein
MNKIRCQLKIIHETMTFKLGQKRGILVTFGFILGFKFLNCSIKKVLLVETNNQNSNSKTFEYSITIYEWTGRDLHPRFESLF